MGLQRGEDKDLAKHLSIGEQIIAGDGKEVSTLKLLLGILSALRVYQRLVE